MKKPEVVYHFTHSTCLPWIIMEGALYPSQPFKDGSCGGCNRYLWMTSVPDADYHMRPTDFPLELDNDPGESVWAQGRLAMVRFTLARADFEPWTEVVKKPPWTRRQIARWKQWEEVLHFGDRPENWYLRREPLPLNRVLKIEAKARFNPDWTRVRPTKRHVRAISEDPPTLALELLNSEFYSTQCSDGFRVPEHYEITDMYDEAADYADF
jgi:hypothetical protein